MVCLLPYTYFNEECTMNLIESQEQDVYRHVSSEEENDLEEDDPWPLDDNTLYTIIHTGEEEDVDHNGINQALQDLNH